MTPSQILFLLIAVSTLGAGLMVVTRRNMVHAALWLIVSLFGIAVLFALLNANFLAVAQVVIYIGAISIVIIFTIMLTRRVAKDMGPQINPNWGWAGFISILLFGGLGLTFLNWQGVSKIMPVMDAGIDPIKQLGMALVSLDAYILPFEVASILLLAALIGAIIVAWDRKTR